MQESDREALASETFCRHRLLPRAAFSLRRREITISEGPVQGLAGVAEVNVGGDADARVGIVKGAVREEVFGPSERLKRMRGGGPG